MNALYRSVHSFSIRNRLLLAVVLTCFTALSARAQTTNTWDGSSSSDWNTATNWSGNHVPLATEDVVIPNVTTYPVLSTTAVVNSVEVSAASSFTITAAGSLTINGSKTDSPYSYAFLAWGSVSNSGQVVITMTESVGEVGLFNRGGVGGLGFTNNAGASVQIDGSSYAGIYNTATFNNGGTITIGASTPVGSYGVYSSGGFYNNTGGILSIDRSTVAGFYNTGGISTNDGTILIGSLAPMGTVGYYNSGFNLTTNTGIITIDHTTTNAFLNNSSFKNTGTITIGALGPVGTEAISLNNNFTNDGCGALVDILADAMITTTNASSNRFSNINGATIIERSSGTSVIYDNSGLIRDLNGGNFNFTNSNTGVLTTAAGGITANPSLTITQGQSTTLTAEGSAPYTWSSGQNTQSIEVTTSGPYSVTSTIAGCSRVSSVTVTVNPATLTLTGLAANPSTVCVGSPVTFTASVGIASGTYNYTLTNGSSSENGTSSSAVFSYTLTASGSGPQTFTLTVSTSGQEATTTTTVTVNSATTPTLTTNVAPSSPGSTTVIQNTPGLTLTATGCSGTLAWTGPNSPTGSTVSVSTVNTGTLSYSVVCQQSGCTSPPATFDITVIPSLVSGSFDGFVYGADCSTFRGWTWDRNKPNTPIPVDILDGPTVIASLMADVFRQDLQTAGKGNGKHAFFFSIPEALKDGLAHNLSARVAGSSFILKDSPKALICVGTGTPENKAPVPPSPTVIITPLAAQVGVPFSGTLVPFTDPEGGALTYALSGLPDGLTLNSGTRVISGTPFQEGTFTLTYSATDPGNLTNSVSFQLIVNPTPTTTVSGSFEGYLDKVECGTIRGWVWDRNKPNAPVTVEFYTGNTFWGSVVANIYRVDLKNAGKGNGAHAYSFEVPAVLKDGTTRLIYGRVQGSTFVLKDSGKPLTCNVPVRLSAETASDLQVTVLGNPVSGQSVAVEIRGSEGQPLRMQVTDVQGRIVSDRLLKKAGTLEQQRVELGHQASGFLFLQVSTPTQQRTIKILTN